jgi:hypothetical protein
LNGRQWKIAAAVALFAVAAIIVIRTVSGGGPLSSRISFADATTGEIVWLDRDDVTVLPAPNPATGEPTLFPCRVREDGTAVLEERYAGALERLGDRAKAVDPTTFVVRKP